MGQLTNLYVSQSYQGLLKLTDSTTGLTPSLQTVQDGLGGNSPLQISQTEVNISGSFYINNVPITNGTSGTSGTSGVAGSSGTSGTSGSNGSSGTSGTSGVSGSAGTSGTSGTSGGTGSSGTSGTSGGTGSSGTSGTSGQDGSSGTSGTSGGTGSSGTSGTSGVDGSSGTSGTSGSSGVSPSLVGVITTGSITSTQVITGSLNLPDVIISGSLIGGVVNNGQIDVFSEAFNSGSVKLNISASNAISQSNIIFGSATGPVSAAFTGSIVMSGSNNILLNAVRTVGTVGTYGLVGNNNIFTNTIPTYQTGSYPSPTITNNFGPGAISLFFTTGSQAAPSIAGNSIFGTGLTARHNSGSLSMSQNLILGTLNSFASQSFLSASVSVPTIQQNLIAGTLNLGHTSSSIVLLGNIVNGNAMGIRNEFSSSFSNATNIVNVQRNNILGNNVQIFVTGSPSSADARNISDNLLGGINSNVTSSHNGSNNAHLHGTIVFGSGLVVSASNAVNTGGSTFVGRFNATGSNQESSNDAVFVVGTGTGASARRNALHIDNGSNVRITGSLNVSGAMTLGYNDGVDNITSISQGAGTILYRNAGKYTTAIGEFTGTQNKFANGTNNILLGGFNSQFSTGSQNFLALPTGGNFKSGSINIIIGNTQNIISGSQNIIIGDAPSSLGPQVDSHFIIKGQSETNSYLFKSGSGANVPIQIGFPVQVTGSINVSGDVQFASGSNKTMGTFVLNGGNPGTATVSNTLVTANSLIFLTKQTNANSGAGTVSVTSKGSNTFSVTSDHNGDTDTVAYLIINPA